MTNQAFSKIWIIAILVVIAGAFLMYERTLPVAALDESNPWLFIPLGDDDMVIHEAQSGDVKYKKGTKIQVNGFNLGGVEFWATPVGGEKNILLGTAIKKEKTHPEEKGETWVFTFSSDQTLSNLLAITFDARGNEVGRINFPYFENVTKEEREKISNWKNYKNERWGYEIKYSPVHGNIDEEDQGKKVTIGSRTMPCYRILARENISSFDDLKSLMLEPIKEVAPPDLEIKWKDSMVSEEEAIEMSYESFAGGYTGVVHRTGLIKNSVAYIFILVDGSESEYYKMLSTFQFLE